MIGVESFSCFMLSNSCFGRMQTLLKASFMPSCSEAAPSPPRPGRPRKLCASLAPSCAESAWRRQCPSTRGRASSSGPGDLDCVATDAVWRPGHAPGAAGPVDQATFARRSTILAHGVDMSCRPEPRGRPKSFANISCSCQRSPRSGRRPPHGPGRHLQELAARIPGDLRSKLMRYKCVRLVSRRNLFARAKAQADQGRQTAVTLGSHSCPQSPPWRNPTVTIRAIQAVRYIAQLSRRLT